MVKTEMNNAEAKKKKTLPTSSRYSPRIAGRVSQSNPSETN